MSALITCGRADICDRRLSSRTAAQVILCRLTSITNLRSKDHEKVERLYDRRSDADM